MFTKEQLAEAAKSVIAELASDPEVTWFVDANVVISGDAARLLNGHRRVMSTPDVAAEVRKRPESRTANQLITRIEQDGGLVARERFFDSAAGFDLLVGCAKRLAPGVKLGKYHFVREMGVTAEAAEARAIEVIGNAGAIFKCHMTGGGADRGRFIGGMAPIDKGSRRSWFRYPNKRRRRSGQEYRFSDETLVATALSNAILLRQKTCLLSNDTDCAAILKQLTDNLLWAVTTAEFRDKGVSPDPDEFIDRWNGWCRHVDDYRLGLIDERILDPTDEASGAPVLYRFVQDELVVCRVTDSVIAGFAYPSGVAEFVRTTNCPVVWTGLDNTPP